MKRLFIFLTILALAACTSPPTATLLPVETSVYLTLQAEPKTNTPTYTLTPTTSPTPQTIGTTQAVNVSSAIAGGECLPTETERIRGLVTRVLDGETIEVAVGNDVLRVRYIGVDAPGITPIEWQGPEAVNMNSRLVSGQFVILIKDVSEVDANGFLLRYVVANNAFINYELVRMGLAKAVAMPPDITCQEALAAAQVTAQASISGVWAPTPIPTATITPTPTITPTVTPTVTPVCFCNRHYTCNNFPTQKAAQACYNYCTVKQNIYIGLDDQNKNGRVCEGLP
ncbi:MAG: thermonuclease family protein [Chloroflexota bacterium]